VFVFKQNCGRTTMIFKLCLWVYLTTPIFTAKRVHSLLRDDSVYGLSIKCGWNPL